MITKILTRDVVAPFTKTDYPSDLPSFNEDKVDSVTLYSPWWGTIPLTVAAYSAADWADGTKPAAGEIMFSETDRQWKANQWIVGFFGDVLEAIVRPYNERAPEP
jgi:hypothetical protein